MNGEFPTNGLVYRNLFDEASTSKSTPSSPLILVMPRDKYNYMKALPVEALILELLKGRPQTFVITCALNLKMN